MKILRDFRDTYVGLWQEAFHEPHPFNGFLCLFVLLMSHAGVILLALLIAGVLP